MNNDDSQFAWWSRLRHSGLLLSPVVQIEKYAEPPEELKWYQPDKLRTAYTRFVASIDRSKDRPQLAQGDILTWVDAVLEKYIGHNDQRLARSHNIPESLTAIFRIGSRTETLKPDLVLFAEDGKTPLLLVKADTSPHIGRGKGRTEYAKFLELLRGSGHRLGLLTNGLQFRLVYAGLDFESWCEWESERWFEDSEGTEELHGLRQLLFPIQETNNKGEVIGAGLPGLLHAVEESRKRQADLSQVLRENVRQAVELLLIDVSTASRTDPELFHALMSPESSDKQLTDAEAHEALMQATVRVVMRMVVCLFAESRGLLPVHDLIFSQSYGVRTLYELLDETTRHEGGQLGLRDRRSAWPRLMALFRLIHGGSAHGGFTLRPYGGALFRPGDADDSDAVSRALFILEHKVTVNDSTIYRVLKKLLRGPLPVLRGRTKTYVEGPVDYTELRTEFIGLIYEGLLDYRVKRTTDEIGPQVFLNLGRQPVLPLSRLEAMLEENPKSLKDLFTTLKKEKVTATVESDEEEDGSEDQATDTDESQDGSLEVTVEKHANEEELHGQSYLDSVQAARRWARKAIIETKLISKQRTRETDTEYDKRIEDAIDDLIDRVVSPGEFYLVRAGNTRKGTGTFYTRPQLAVPTVHRTLEPLCYDKNDDGTLTPKAPEELLALKVCDPACGSASFLVAALHYLTDSLYKSLCHHCGLNDPTQAAKITLPFGRSRTKSKEEEIVPFLPNDPVLGDQFKESVEARLRRHVVERCIYGVDINPLAVEFARVSLWVETLDDKLPFSFLDHKIKVGNSLVGCWLDRVEDYPLKAWEREGGDGKKGERTQRIEEFLKGEKVGNRRTGDGRIKQEMRQVIKSKFAEQVSLFPDLNLTTESVVNNTRAEYERLHDFPVSDPDERERYYRDHIENSPAICTLRAAMDEWCAIWFWPTDKESMRHVPTPLTFHTPNFESEVIVGQLATDLRFFHWELEFPDVFTTDRSGFDGMIGNPPWDVMKPNSQEFFIEFDPLYRSYDKQRALREQKKIFAAFEPVAYQWDDYKGRFRALSNFFKSVARPFDIPLARAGEGSRLSSLWEKHRSSHIEYSSSDHPFYLQGSADLNLYKLFAEMFWRQLRTDGRMGVILPTGIYSDFGTKDLRQAFFDKGRIEFLYAFQNEKRVFIAAHHSFKQVCLVATKGGTTKSFRVRFRMGVGDSPESHEIATDMLASQNSGMVFSPADIRSSSPESLSIVELRDPKDLKILRVISKSAVRIGDLLGDTLDYNQGINLTSDSRLFPRTEKWEENGFGRSRFGFWVNDKGEEAFPLYQGAMFHHFRPFYKAFETGSGRVNQWRYHNTAENRIAPKYLISRNAASKLSKNHDQLRFAFRDICRNTDERTYIGTIIPPFPSGNTVPSMTPVDDDLKFLLFFSGVCSSFVCDYLARFRTSGAHINQFILKDIQVPQYVASSVTKRLGIGTARLSFTHCCFAPYWLRLREFWPELSQNHWKQWWATTEADRIRLRAETEAYSCDLYGLAPEDVDWIVRSDISDSKGFYRVERELPFRQRITGLVAAAFRTLKEGKWSAESAAEMSNDEFFDILGIPELTNAEVAKAKGESGPLILNRDGCHVWTPGTFPEDDPRHGWTWEDCWNDAIAILGSEDAVRAYIEGKPKEPNEESEYTGPRDLFGDPIIEKPRQRKSF